MKSVIRSAAVLAAMTSASGGDALANDRDIAAISLPASSCVVDQNSPVQDSVYSGIGVARRWIKGATLMLCPLTINNIEVSSGKNDNDITHFRVLFRDTDGSGSDSQLNIFLVRGYLQNGEMKWQDVCDWFSGYTPVPGNVYGWGRANCPHDVLPNSFYNFKVVMLNYQDYGFVEFGGIDFK